MRTWGLRWNIYTGLQGGRGEESGPGVDGDVAGGGGWIALKDKARGSDGAGAVDAEARVAAVVEKQVGAAAALLVADNAAGEVRGNLLGRLPLLPVVAHGVPQDGGEA